MNTVSVNKLVNKVQFPSSKDGIALLDRSCAYSIPCECEFSCIVETKRAFKFRVNEHEARL